MYKETELYKRAYDILNDNTRLFNGRNMILPSSTFSNYNGFWNWDSAFIALGVSDWNVDLALEQCSLFFDNMDERGMTIDAFLMDGRRFDSISKPPVFAWVLCEIAKRYDRPDVADRFYDQLVKNEAFWVKYRKKSGLFHYDAFSVGEDYVKDARNESGWDNSPRWDMGAHNVYAIDLNCYMILFYRSLAYFAKIKGFDDNKWIQKENELKENINEHLWCEQAGTYLDYNFVNGEFVNVLTPASFMPLFVEIAPEEKAEKMKELASSEAFYPLMPCVAYTDGNYNDKDYWRGPTWVNVAYFAVKGLKNYGYTELAEKYKDNILSMCYNEKRSIYEYYDSKTGEGLNADTFSWTSVFIIEFIKRF